MAKSNARKNVMMVSEGKLESGQPSKYAYYTTKSSRDPNKLQLRKFDPRTGRYEIFKEKKVPK